MSLADQIKDVALGMGFDAIGITCASPLDHADGPPYNKLSWLEKSWEKRFEPQSLLANAKSVICLAIKQSTLDISYISKHAVGRDYHLKVREMLENLWEEISKLAPGSECKICIDSSPIAEKPYAVNAGIGWQGKNSLLILPNKGSYYFLGEIITNIDLTPDNPCTRSCGNCSICIDSCPTKAIVSPGVIDQGRCIAYQTIENKGPIPMEIRPFVKSIYGCDICQEGCPFNSNQNPVASNRKNGKFNNLNNLKLADVLYLSKNDFEKHFKDTVLERVGLQRLKRNVCVVLGNTNFPGAMEALTYFVKHGDDLVKEHAMWALQCKTG